MEHTITQEPILLFKEWFDEACAQEGQHEPTAMAVATADKEGRPSARILLLKGYDDRGFRFFTNLTSRKGKELLENPFASLCFYWDKLDRQVRIEGRIERVTEKESDDYFASRSRGSQIGAWASKQSLAIENEHALPERVKQITEQFGGQGTIPRPPFWSGFRVIPERIEFWQKGEFRLHTRILYSQKPTGWNVERLYP